MFNSELNIRGWVEYEHTRNGVVLLRDAGPNIVMQLGKELVAQVMRVTGAPVTPGWGAIGDGAADLVDSQTDLQGAEHLRVAFAAVAAPILNDLTYSFSFTHPGGGTGTVAVNEVGLFNAAPAGPASGTMFARFLTQTFQFAAADTFAVDWTLTYG